MLALPSRLGESQKSYSVLSIGSLCLRNFGKDKQNPLQTPALASPSRAWKSRVPAFCYAGWLCSLPLGTTAEDMAPAFAVLAGCAHCAKVAIAKDMASCFCCAGRALRCNQRGYGPMFLLCWTACAGCSHSFVSPPWKVGNIFKLMRVMAELYPCLKHTRPRASSQHCAHARHLDRHTRSRASSQHCTHAWHMVSTPAHAHVAQMSGTQKPAWHMVSAPAHSHVAQMYLCLAHGKHTRSRASSQQCTHAWHMVSARPRASRSNALMSGTR